MVIGWVRDRRSFLLEDYPHPFGSTPPGSEQDVPAQAGRYLQLLHRQTPDTDRTATVCVPRQNLETEKRLSSKADRDPQIGCGLAPVLDPQTNEQERTNKQDITCLQLGPVCPQTEKDYLWVVDYPTPDPEPAPTPTPPIFVPLGPGPPSLIGSCNSPAGG